jgi:hypothetical protein
MALAQPTGLRVQALEPFATLDQSVSRENPAQTVVTLEQSTGGVRPARTVATLEQLSGYLRKTPAGTVATLTQHAGNLRINPASTVATLEQDVLFERVNDPLTIATLSQRVDRTTAARTLGRLRQTVQAVAGAGPAPAALPSHTLVFLDDADITDQCSPVTEIAASEGDNRTATVTLYPGSGPINITSYQGRSLDILHRIGGNWQTAFNGTVDVPTYRRDSRTLQLRCSDLRGERLGREDQSRLKTLTGGLYSNVTQREDAEGEQWVRELMKTVEGSLDYTSAGALRYRPWAVAAPRFTLEGGDIHHREVALEFATRSEIINRVPISIAFRWYKRNTFITHIGVGVRISNVCKQGTCLPDPDQILPTKEAALGAAYNIAGWRVLTATAGSPPASGWYRYGVFNDKVLYGTTTAFRDTYATAINATLIRYVSQGMRSTSNISLEAPQSIDQFGEIDGSPLSFSIDTRVDPSVFEDTGCYSRPEQDRLADRTRAIEAAQAMAAKQIRGSHRNNYASFRYKPKTGRPGARQLLPVEIGDTISITTGEINATGWVTEFQHSLTRDGDRYTDIKLAISRVDSALSVTENVEVPGVATPTRINPEAQQAEPRLCVTDDEDGDDAPLRSDIAKDGSVTLVAPSIAPAYTDELVGDSSHDYSIAIPVNPFTVEVP